MFMGISDQVEGTGERRPVANTESSGYEITQIELICTRSIVSEAQNASTGAILCKAL